MLMSRTVTENGPKAQGHKGFLKKQNKKTRFEKNLLSNTGGVKAIHERELSYTTLS